jgi:dsDNA-binding SOS-regulon protein
MIERGRSFLIRLFGDEGWQERLSSMKAEAERYWALSEEERIIEDLAESQRISKEEARELREYRGRRYADWRDELDSMLETSDLDSPSTAEREDS